MISSRNFLRALGGATGLAIASALFSNTLVGHLDSTSAIPSDIADEIKSSIFSTPNMSGLMEEQRVIILDLYSRAARSVFYFWVGCIGLCWVLMFFIKDKGLQRKEEKQEITAATDQVLDEESGSSTASGDERVSAQGGKKSNDLVTAIRSD